MSIYDMKMRGWFDKGEPLRKLTPEELATLKRGEEIDVSQNNEVYRIFIKKSALSATEIKADDVVIRRIR